MTLQAQRHQSGGYLDIHIACRLMLAAVQAMPCTRLVEDCQRHTARLCARLVHHIPAQSLNSETCCAAL